MATTRVVSYDPMMTTRVVSYDLVTTLTDNSKLATSLTVGYIRHPYKAYQILRDQKRKNASQYFPNMRFPPLPPHCLHHGKYCCNTGSAAISLTATPCATILLLSLVRFAVFYEKLHHFYGVNFVTWQPSGQKGGKMVIKDM